MLQFACEQAGTKRSDEPQAHAPSAEGQPAKPKAEPADNSRCHVCHFTYQDEPLSVVHAKAGIGCERCHGPSDAHCSDEDNITPPDVMFPEAKIGPFCKTCHDLTRMTHNAEAMQAHGAASADTVCTDCHGKHQLAKPRRRWDKTTGELIKGS